MEPGDTGTSMVSTPPQDNQGDTDKHRPFKCRYCNYAATQRTHLRCHERTHTGEKPYKCNICGYAAAQKTNLNSHQRVHSGERPYKCKLCPYAAIQRSNLTSHYKAKHGVHRPTIYIEHDSPSSMHIDHHSNNTLSDIAAAHGIEQVQSYSNAGLPYPPHYGEQFSQLTMVRTPNVHVSMNGNHCDVPVSIDTHPARQSDRTPSTTSSSVQGEDIMDLTCIKKEEEAVLVSEEVTDVTIDTSETYQQPDYNNDESSPIYTASDNVRQNQTYESPGTTVYSNYGEEPQRQSFDCQDVDINASIHNQEQHKQGTQDSYIPEGKSPHHQQAERNDSCSGSVKVDNRWTENHSVQEHSHDEASQPSDDYQSADSAGNFGSPQTQRQVSSQRNSPRVTTQRHVCRYCDISFGDYLMYTVHRGFHTYGDPLRCNMCGVKYRIPLEFFVHTHSGVHGSSTDQ